jgi:hypothetical protein
MQNRWTGFINFIGNLEVSFCTQPFLQQYRFNEPISGSIGILNHLLPKSDAKWDYVIH